jgi:nucleoside-diphosphate-sugar epimerase
MYGPREHPNRLVAAVARAMLTGEPARTSHGRQIRDYLHVQDVADAIVAVLDGDLTGPVNIGSGVPVTLREIVVRLGSITGRPELLELDAIPARANDAALVVADPKRLAEEVGWRPRFDLQAGLEHTVDWWRAELGHDGVRA